MPHFDITQWIVRIPVLLLAITVHEYAHGRVAYALGDPTARLRGRLTLNPLLHIDPLGALCLFLFNFGWARPVPVDPRYFTNIRRDIILLSIAGPAANFALALGAGLLTRFFLFHNELYQMILIYMLLMNLGLGLFNLIPLPPLDGSHVLENLLPPRAALRYREFGRYGPFVIMGVVLLDSMANTGIFRAVLIGPMRFLAQLFSGVAFF